MGMARLEGRKACLPPWMLAAVAKTTDMKDCEAFLTRTFTTSLQRTGILELRRPVYKVIIRALWTVSCCWLITIPQQVHLHGC